MIVRINQLDPAAAEHATGWMAGTACGPIERAWSVGTFAYQLLILEHDEQHQPVNNSARQEQLCKMLPKVIDALSAAEDRVVVRLDGPFRPDGIAPAFLFAADPGRCARFSYSSADQLSDSDPPIVSIRLFPRAPYLAELCDKPRADQTVRLRAFGMPDEFVDPMLDTAELDDERWRDLLPRVGFMISTSSDVLSLLIWTPRYDAEETRRRITDHLGGKESVNGDLSTAERK